MAVATPTTRHTSWMLTPGNMRRVEALAPDVAHRALGSPEDYAVDYTKTPVTPDGFASTPVKGYTSLGAFRREMTDGTFPDGVRSVLYDIETWAATPEEEWRHPKRSMKQFCDLAHQYGLEAIVIPHPGIAKALGRRPFESIGHAFVRHNIAGDAARSADVVAVQAQSYQLDVKRYSDFVRRAASQVRSANPQARFMTELSTGAGSPSSAAQLVRAFRSVANVIDGCYLSISGKRDPDDPTKQARWAAQLLERVTPRDEV